MPYTFPIRKLFLAAAHPAVVLDLLSVQAQLVEALQLARRYVEKDVIAALKNNFGVVDNDPWANAAVDARDSVDAALARATEEPT